MTIELEEPELESNAQVFRDLFAGTVGGIAQVLVGQPFDTVKVRLQSAPEGTYDGAVGVIKQLLKSEGPKGFYKGTLTPLIGVGACVSVQFSANEMMKRYFNEKSNGKALGLLDYFTCGAVAGFSNGFLASPIEHIRIQLQVLDTYNGPVQCARAMFQGHGLRTLYKGLAPTLMRESGGLGVYFATYEKLVASTLEQNPLVSRSEIPAWKLCLFGGLSGYTLWITIYPIDVVKSKLQADSVSKPKYTSSLQVFRDIWTSKGVKGFYRGFLPTILRAAPANAATFAAFEVTMNYITPSR